MYKLLMGLLFWLIVFPILTLTIGFTVAYVRFAVGNGLLPAPQAVFAFLLGVPQLGFALLVGWLPLIFLMSFSITLFSYILVIKNEPVTNDRNELPP